jgi:hypothetical protein
LRPRGAETLHEALCGGLLPVFRTTGNVTMLQGGRGRQSNTSYRWTPMTGRPKSSSLLWILGLITSFCVTALASQQPAQHAADSAPAGATARCRDGSYSYSATRSGTCSHHGGVAQWLPTRDASEASDTSSGRYFYPDGYFFPEPPIIVGDYEIYMLELSTANFYYGGKLHYDKPEPLTEPQLLSIRLRSDTTKGVPAAMCRERRVSADTLYLRCESKYLGVITVEGNFLDRRGDFGSLFASHPHPEFVLSATVTVSRGGRVVYTGRHRFRFFTGD